jgi:hypothetical protein
VSSAVPRTIARWKALAHGPIEKLAENLWRVLGKIPRLSLRRTMTIARLGDGRLVIHSAVALDDASMQQLEAWGTPAFLIVPNGFHRLDAPAFKARYPELRVLAPRGSRDKVARVIPVDGTLEDFPPEASVRFEPIAGVGEVEGAMLVESADGVTVVLGDLVFNMDRQRDPLGFLFTTLLGSAPGPRVSRFVKAALVKDRAAFRRELERLAALPRLVRLIVAHEKLAQGADAAAVLIAASKHL